MRQKTRRKLNDNEQQCLRRNIANIGNIDELLL